MFSVIKRNGKIEAFDARKIVKAIELAFNDVEHEVSNSAHILAQSIATIISQIPGEMTVEDIQDKVEELLMNSHRKDVAKAYIQWRYKRQLVRRENTTDEALLELIAGKNEYWNDENANKNAMVVHTMRDYIAGETSKDVSRRLLIPEDIVKAHDDGIIHFHDLDYFIQPIHNCCLINIDDMLQNGTCINGVKIDKPHRLITAATITSQIVAFVGSSQYGGCTLSLSHLAPFVEESRKKFRTRFEKIVKDENELKMLVEQETNKEIIDSMQTIFYQLNSLNSSNGQAPFVSVCMYLNEVKDERMKADLARLIEEMLKQRMQGFKNEHDVFITPAFPKLLYFLEEDNIKPGTKYWYLTELAARCCAKRMAPDFISEKVMKQLKNGESYPCMGCVDGDEVITYKINDALYVESFKRFWDRLNSIQPPLEQIKGNNKNLYYDACALSDNITIYDTKEHKFVKVRKIIRNTSNKWVNVKISGGRFLTCTEDHPFHTNRGRIQAKYLIPDKDEVIISNFQYSEENINYDPNKAWLLGFILCDGCYQRQMSSCIALTGEDDIQQAYIDRMKQIFDVDIDVIEWHRGVKGDYKELRVPVGEKRKQIIREVESLFEGVRKIDRHIPNEVFKWDRCSKINFLAGMIDADGYLHPTTGHVQIGSTNRELAIQQMLLAQSLGMSSSIYPNHYDGKTANKIRWLVEFSPSEDLLQAIICQKKINNYNTSRKFVKRESESSIIKSIETFDLESFSFDVETESDHFEVSGIYSHNCRSFLTPDIMKENYARAKNFDDSLVAGNVGHYYGRFNQGVVTINLPDVALSAKNEFEDNDYEEKGETVFDVFWRILNERLELCHRALRVRHERLLKTVSDNAPIMWQHGALARLNPHESIKELLYHGYSTISLGYAGLYECVKVMTNEDQTSGKGKEFGLQVMKAMNDKAGEWKREENISYSVYGTPIESTTWKFAKSIKKRFGDKVFVKLDGHDRQFITNSYHVPVWKRMTGFEKLAIEAEFQKLSPGGAVSYIECCDLTKNIPAVLQIIQYIYETIMYAEINLRSTDCCFECGFEGEILMIDDGGRLKWHCPKCGNENQQKMSISRRVCGYLTSANTFNQGRMNDMRDRVLHIDDMI